MEQIFINGLEIDIPKKSLTRKIRIGDIGNISTRKSTFSYTLVIEDTDVNRAVFDMLAVTGNTSRKPYEYLVCDYVVDGLYLISKGYATITDFKKGYKLNMYDGLIDLAEQLKGLKIVDLPFSELDHTLTVNNYVNSYSNTDGFIYGIADFGKGIQAPISVETQLPCIFSHTIFRKIFENLGIFISGQFFENDVDYLNEVVTPSKGLEMVQVALTSINSGNLSTNIVSENEYTSSYIFSENRFSISSLGLSGFTNVNSSIVADSTGVYRIQLTASFNSYNCFVSYRVKLNGNIVGIIVLATNADTGNGVRSDSFTFNLEAGDVIELFSYAAAGDVSNSGVNDNIGDIYTLNYSVSVSGSIFEEVGGQLVKPIELIDDTLQIDFVKDILRRHAIIMQPIKDTSNYRFQKLEKILNNRSDSEDWTKKLKNIDSIKYVPNYGKINLAKYSYPEEIVFPNNDGEMIVDNENIKPEKTLFSSFFEIPIKRAFGYLSQDIYKIPVWKTGEAGIENSETPIKTMKISRVNVAIEARLFDQLTTISVSTGVPFLNLGNMSMQYYLDVNYAALKSLITNYRKAEAYVSLSPLDIYYLDFFKLKYFEQKQRFYYLDSVNNTSGKLSKIVMYEIQEFNENNAPSQSGNYSFTVGHGSEFFINTNSFLSNYIDIENDAALSVKFVSGFNSQILLKNNGVLIDSEIEINVSDLNLSAVEIVNGVAAYNRAWIFYISDEGSSQYSVAAGNLTANVDQYVNTAPVSNAGNDIVIGLLNQNITDEHTVNVNGSQSYDSTGNISSFLWELQSKPQNSNGYIVNTFQGIAAALKIPNELDSIGVYILKLTVVDEYGASDSDTMQIDVSQGTFFSDDGGLSPT